MNTEELPNLVSVARLRIGARFSFLGRLHPETYWKSVYIFCHKKGPASALERGQSWWVCDEQTGQLLQVRFSTYYVTFYGYAWLLIDTV